MILEVYEEYGTMQWCFFKGSYGTLLNTDLFKLSGEAAHVQDGSARDTC